MKISKTSQNKALMHLSKPVNISLGALILPLNLKFKINNTPN
jgi:hypothetical protein